MASLFPPQFWRDAPGYRFRHHYYARRRPVANSMDRALRLFSGGVLVLLGAAFLVLPGPSLPPLVLGAALIAGESLRVARWLDSVELRLRNWRA
jgi:hypothetical protein